MEVKEDLQVERATKEIPNDEGAAKKVDVEAKVMERGGRRQHCGGAIFNLMV